MPFLLKGNAENIFTAFGLNWAVDKRKDSASTVIEDDVPRTCFFGNEEQGRHYFETWKEVAQNKKTGQSDYYVQGNMSADNLFLLLGPENPFFSDKSGSEGWEEHYFYKHFAYVNDKNELCGLALMCRRDDPTQWFIGIINSTHLLPHQRTVTMLSSFDLNSSLQKTTLGVDISIVDNSSTTFIDAINSGLVQGFLSNVITSDSGEFDLKCLRIDQLLRTLQASTPINLVQDIVPFAEIGSKELFAENKVLDLLAKHDLRLTTAMLKDCISPAGALRKELERFKSSENYKIDKEYLKMLIMFYQAEALDQCRTILGNHDLLLQIDLLMEEPHKKELIMFLIKQNYQHDLFKLIISDEAYFTPIRILVEYGLLEKEISELLNLAGKQEELRFIHALTDLNCKKLCLVFWIKGQLTLDEYKEIVAIINDNPSLAETLLALDKTQTVAIEDLKKSIFDPLKRQVKNIVHHFAAEFKNCKITKDHLKILSDFDSELELKALINTLNVLKGVKLADPQRAYHAALKLDNEGMLVRLFVPQFAKIEDKEARQALIEIFFIGITKGPVLQATALEGLNDKPSVLELAKNMHERFLCARQMQDLHFSNDVVNFAAEDSIKAACFRRIVLRVEEECKRVHKRVSESWDHNRLEIISGWQNAHEEYRSTLYSLAYTSLTSNVAADPEKLKQKISEAESKVLAIVDPKIQSWVYLALVVIANILISALTLGAANYFKHSATGNYWFFNRTESGEKLSILDEEVLQELIEPPKAP